MAVKIETLEESIAGGGGLTSRPSGPGKPGGVPAKRGGVQCSLKSNNPSRPVLSRTGHPSHWERKFAREDIRTALAVRSSPVLLIIPRGWSGEIFWGGATFGSPWAARHTVSFWAKRDRIVFQQAAGRAATQIFLISFLRHPLFVFQNGNLVPPSSDCITLQPRATSKILNLPFVRAV